MMYVHVLCITAAVVLGLLAAGPAEAQQPLMELKSTVEISDTTVNGPVLFNEDYFGISVAGIGDLDNDGIPDIAVGADGDDAGGDSRGAIHIMFMNRDGSVKSTVEIDDTTANGPTLSNVDFFGASVAGIGDLDNDGIPDIAAGAYEDDLVIANDDDHGAIHIMFMNRDGSVKSTTEINSTTTNGPALSIADQFGISVAGIGDLDNDGIPDIAAGANWDDLVFANDDDHGAIHIMFMNRDGSVKSTTEINSTTANGPALSDNDHFGISVAGIGDLDNDGIPDIAAGADGDDAGGDSRGAIHIMFMNRDGTIKSTVEINDTAANGPSLSNSDHFGVSVANIGDLDLDGIPDIAAGADGDDAGGDSRGAIHVMFMNRDGTIKSTTEINDTTTNGPVLSNDDYFGISVAGIGDLDNDGIPDIASGANEDDLVFANDDDRGAIHIMFSDIDLPAITISSSAGADGSTTSDSAASFSILFDRPVTGFTASDIAIGGLAGGSISGFAGSGAGPYTFTFTTANAGTLVLQIPASSTIPPNLAATFTITFAKLLFGTADHVSESGSPDARLLNINSMTTYDTPDKRYAITTSLIDGGIQILDITDPYRPLVLGQIDPQQTSSLLFSSASAVAEIGNKRYAAVGTSTSVVGIQMVDITDPNIPKISGQLANDSSVRIAGVSDIHTFKLGSKTYAVVASGAGVQLADISDPDNPTVSGYLESSGSNLLDTPIQMELYRESGGTYAVIVNDPTGSSRDGIQIVDISDPDNPTPAGKLIDDGNLALKQPRGLEIISMQGRTYALVAANIDDGIQIVDISDPNNPTARGSLTDSAGLMLNGAHGVSVIHLDGRPYAIVNAHVEDGIQIVDISDPDNPRAEGQIANDAHLLLDNPLDIKSMEIGGASYAAVLSAGDDAVQLLRIYAPSDVQDWSATLTARDHSGSRHGCTDEMISSNPSISCRHMLTEPVFLLDGTAHRVSQVYVDRTADTFNFVTEPPATSSLGNYHLSVGTSQFNLACGPYSDDPCRTAWSSVSKFLLWSEGTMVPMSFDRKSVIHPTPDRPAGWHPTLHVQDLGNGRLGCDNSVTGAACSQFLNPGTLEINGHTHHITMIYTDSDSLHITITGPDADSLAGYTLNINGLEFIAGPPDNPGEYSWYGLDRESAPNSGTPHPEIPHILGWKADTPVRLGLVGTPAPAPEPERPLAPRQVTWQTDWSPALTVADLGNGRLGCDDTSADTASQCGNAITAPTFELQGMTYTITQISLEKALVYHGGQTTGRLIISISPTPAYDVFRNYTLHVESLELNFGPGSGDSAKTDWIGVGKALDYWSDGTRVNLSLSDR